MPKNKSIIQQVAGGGILEHAASDPCGHGGQTHHAGPDQ